MATYQNYIICYDIECNKIRKKFFNELKAIGLIPIQKSVFFGQMNRAEINAFKRIAYRLLDEKQDKCIWLKTELKEITNKEAIGYKDLRIIDADGFFTL